MGRMGIELMIVSFITLVKKKIEREIKKGLFCFLRE